jgi:Fe-S cluster biogenesis protein NfuA
MEATDIKITAEPMDENVCRFTVSVPVYPGGSATFEDPETASLSPLATALFNIEPVVGVRISNNLVTVTKEGIADWAPIARLIGQAIRTHLVSGQPTVSDEYKASLPSAEDIKRKVKELFDTEINPAVAAHGGYVDLIDVQGNNVYVRMGGGCQGCGAANVTLKQGIEKAIRRVVPEVGEVLDTTDHAAGNNPYYAPTK